MALPETEASGTKKRLSRKSGGIDFYSSVDSRAVGSNDRKIDSYFLEGVPAVCMSILVVELCERLAFYTFVGTQEFFLEHLGYSLSEASGMNAAMSTLCMAWALFAGWVADAILGRYQAILAFGAVYVAGSLLAAWSAFPRAESPIVYMFGIMVLVPLGTAGIKSNISNFGADQYDTNDPVQAEAQKKFFSWFYLSINLGSAVSYGYLTTMGSSGGLGIPKRYGYFAVYTIAAIAMACAVGIFWSGRFKYVMQPARGSSALGAVSKSLYGAACNGSKPARAVCAGMIALAIGIILSVIKAVHPTAKAGTFFMLFAFVCSAVGIVLVAVPCIDPTWLLCTALAPERGNEGSIRFTGSDVRDFLRLLPMLILSNLAFGALYNSMQYWYQQQACQMDLRFGNTQLSGSFFNIADCLGIVIATPVAVGLVNPKLERITGCFGNAAKFGVGMVFAAFSVVYAAHLEQIRRLSPILPLTSNCAPEGIQMSAMSASSMLIPFLLMGIGEIYTQPIIMHLAYSQSPPSMRTLTAATCLVIGAVSSALFGLQIAMIAPYVPNDLNKGYLDIGYYSNIALGALFYVAFVTVTRIYEQHARENRPASSSF